MAGKQGMKSSKANQVSDRFAVDYLEQLDGRGRVARAIRHRLGSLEQALGGDLSPQQTSLAKRAVFLEAQLERWELDFANGEDVSVPSYLQAINSLIGLYRTLGIERQAKSISLADYLEAKQ